MPSKANRFFKLMVLVLLLSSAMLPSAFAYTENSFPQSHKISVFWNEETDYLFSSQETNMSCVPASVQMVLRAYNVSPTPTQAELAMEMNTDLNHTTDWRYVYIPFNNRGYTEYINGSLSSIIDVALLYLKNSVTLNFAAIIITWYDQSAKDIGKITHGRVVTGYNETGVFYHDPIDGPNRYLNNTDFVNLWNVSNEYRAFVVKSAIVSEEENQELGQMILSFLIENLGIIALFIVGLVSEKHYVSRLATFSNSIALDIFFIRENFIPWYVFLYLTAGTILGVIGLMAYIDDASLPNKYYDVCFLYSSIVTAVILILGALASFLISYLSL